MESALSAHGLVRIAPNPGTPVDGSFHAVTIPSMGNFSGNVAIGGGDGRGASNTGESAYVGCASHTQGIELSQAERAQES